MRARYLQTNKRRQPQEISDILGEVIESAAAGVDVRQADLVTRWKKIVPPDWTLGDPVGVRDAVLLVEVPDGSTASILRYQVEPLMAAITDEFSADLVSSVRVKIRRR